MQPDTLYPNTSRAELAELLHASEADVQPLRDKCTALELKVSKLEAKKGILKDKLVRRSLC